MISDSTLIIMHMTSQISLFLECVGVFLHLPNKRGGSNQPSSKAAWLWGLFHPQRGGVKRLTDWELVGGNFVATGRLLLGVCHTVRIMDLWWNHGFVATHDGIIVLTNKSFRINGISLLPAAAYAKHWPLEHEFSLQNSIIVPYHWLLEKR